MTTQLVIARTRESESLLLPEMVTRHGLITGATGSGKTVTLQKLAESLSAVGIPVFMADIKGDLTGVSQPGRDTAKLQTRLQGIGVTDWAPRGNPVVLWDIFGEKGHRVRATVAALGPLLLARLLMLNEVQAGVLQLIFRIAEDQGLLLLTLRDLHAVIQHVSQHARTLQTQYGNMSSATLGAIQRNLLALEQQGADQFFGEPMLDIHDWLKSTTDGRGPIHILAAEKLYDMPKLYATSLLWLLSELYAQLAEVGDSAQPRLVFFFDEAHLLFNDAPKVLLDKIEQVVRLVRSKGVGIWFISQSPADIPGNILGQLGNRIQHALHAFTPKDQQAVKSAAHSMRTNPAFDSASAIQELRIGEALVSFLDQHGAPAVVQRQMVIAPTSRMGAINEDERHALLAQSPFANKYNQSVARESAHARLQTSAQHGVQDQDAPSKYAPAEAEIGLLGVLKTWLFGRTGPRGGKHSGVVQQTTQKILRQIVNQTIRSVINGLLGRRKR